MRIDFDQGLAFFDFKLRRGIICLDTGVVGSRWAPRSSKPVAGRVAGRGGFDSHALPPCI